MQLEDRESQVRVALFDPTPDIVLVEGSDSTRGILCRSRKFRQHLHDHGSKALSS